MHRTSDTFPLIIIIFERVGKDSIFQQTGALV